MLGQGKYTTMIVARGLTFFSPIRLAEATLLRVVRTPKYTRLPRVACRGTILRLLVRERHCACPWVKRRVCR